MDTRAVDREISLADVRNKIKGWFFYLRKRFLLIGIAVILGGGAGFAYSLIERPVYTANLNFVMEDQAGGGIGQYSGLASMIGIDLNSSGGGIFQGDNIIELYRSRKMIEKTLLSPFDFEGKKTLIVDRYIEMNGLRKAWEKSPSLTKLSFVKAANEKFSRTQDSVMKQIILDVNKNLLSVIKLDKKSSIITVAVKTKDELLSYAFAKTIVANVNEFYVTTKIKKATDNLNILQRQTDSVKRELGFAITSVASSIDVNPNANPARQVLRAPSQRKQVDVQANTAILTELVKNLELSKITIRKEMPLIEIIDEPLLPLDKKKMGKMAVIIGAFAGFFIMVLFLSMRLVFSKID